MTEEEKLEKEKKQKAKTREVNKKIKLIESVVGEIPEKKLPLAQSIIARLAWMMISVEELENLVDTEGYTDTYQNGANQSGTKKNPNLESYLAMMQRYNQTLESLLRLLPPPSSGNDNNMAEIMNFLARKPTVK